MKDLKTTTWYMIQVRNPKTKRWVDWAGLYNKEDAEKEFKKITEITLNEWRLKEHKLVFKR